MPSHRTNDADHLGGTSRVPASSALLPPHFAGDSPLHVAAVGRTERFARFEHLAVLIEGESGTGKSYIARHLHLCSPRARGPFNQVVLSTLDDNIASSDLFGHVIGAYTDARQNRPGHFATANGGTLMLDEIGKASPAVQGKLLHAIEHQEIWPVGADRAIRLNVRLVAATNIPLDTLVERGTFLEDLAARVSNFRIRLPALRERRADIPELVRQFVALRAESCGHPLRAPRVDDELMAALRAADWPRNLRQLDRTVQQLLIEAEDGDIITLDHCVGDLSHLRRTDGDGEKELTPELVQERIRKSPSVAAAARDLGISRSTIYRYLERLPLPSLETDGQSLAF